MSVPKNWACCQTEFAEFKLLMAKALKHRGKHRARVLKEIEEFFCDKVREIMMRQRGYFKEVLLEKKALQTRLQSILNEKSNLEDQNYDLRQKLAAKDVFLHNPSSSLESAS